MRAFAPLLLFFALPLGCGGEPGGGGGAGVGEAPGSLEECEGSSGELSECTEVLFRAFIDATVGFVTVVDEVAGTTALTCEALALDLGAEPGSVTAEDPAARVAEACALAAAKIGEHMPSGASVKLTGTEGQCMTDDAALAACKASCGACSACPKGCDALSLTATSCEAGASTVTPSGPVPQVLLDALQAHLPSLQRACYASASRTLDLAELLADLGAVLTGDSPELGEYEAACAPFAAEAIGAALVTIDASLHGCTAVHGAL